MFRKHNRYVEVGTEIDIVIGDTKLRVTVVNVLIKSKKLVCNFNGSLIDIQLNDDGDFTVHWFDLSVRRGKANIEFDSKSNRFILNDESCYLMNGECVDLCLDNYRYINGYVIDMSPLPTKLEDYKLVDFIVVKTRSGQTITITNDGKFMDGENIRGNVLGDVVINGVIKKESSRLSLAHRLFRGIIG